VKGLSGAALLSALLLASWPAAAQFGTQPGEVEGAAVDPGDAEQVADMKRQLLEDPSVAAAVVERIMRSRLRDRFSAATDRDAQRREIAEFIRNDPDSAAQVAIGLSRDDAQGNDHYESTLLKNTRSKLNFNPNSRKGVLGRLKKASDESRLMGKQDNEDMAEEEKQEILKTMFEGEGSQSGRVLTMEKDGSARPAADGDPTAQLKDSYYDRLSAGNLRGYSPQLLAMQSALNQRRPPGAPALIETGKLDHPTLAFPGFGMRFDIENLEKRLRRERVQALAALLGRSVSAADADDPTFEGVLLAEAKRMGKALKPRLLSRAAALGKARAALDAFMAAAEKAKDPGKISRALLAELGRLQRDGARWIAVAALEEELGRVENEEGFLTPELLAAIDAAPVPADAKAAYKRRGEGYKKRLELLKKNATEALDILQTDAWQAQAAKVEKLVHENGLLRRELSRDIADYSKVPFRIAESRSVQARWRVYAEDLAIRWVPSTTFAKTAANRRGRLARYRDIYLKIASGELANARQLLAVAEAR
jgi:hypothetical protein